MARGDRRQAPTGPALLHVVEEWWSEVASDGWHGQDEPDGQGHRADHDYGWFATGGPYRTWQEAEQRWSELVAHTGQPTRFRIVSTGEALSPAPQRENSGQAATTIYERLGGQSAIRQVVTEFYRRMTEDPLFAPRFRYVDLGRLMNHQIAILTILTGGPNETKRDTMQIHSWLRAAHSQLQLSQGEFDRMVAHLAGTLRDSGVSETDVQTLIHSLEGFRADVVSA